MKKITLILTLAITLIACNNSPKITVSGTINNASSKMVYLIHQDATKPSVIDSVKLTNKQQFTFKIKKSNTPDLYAIAYDKQFLIIALDSTPNIQITANAQNFATQFSIENSPETEKIRDLRNSASQVTQILKGTSDTLLWRQAIVKHQEFAQSIILQNTHSLAAYYAIHQTLGDYYFLSPSDPKQVAYWQAVATGFDIYYPNSQRSKLLKETTIKAINTQKRAELSNLSYEVAVDAENFIEIELPNRGDELVKLSNYKGHLILLDFMAFSVKDALAHNLTLGELYEKYHDKGLEIFQVSLDQDKLFWLKASYNLPWVCVMDENGANSIYAQSYNVTKVPSLFLINKKGEIVQRTSLEEVQSLIEQNL